MMPSLNDADLIRLLQGRALSTAATFVSWAIDPYDKRRTRSPHLYEIDELEEMHLADIAWREVGHDDNPELLAQSRHLAWCFL